MALLRPAFAGLRGAPGAGDFFSRLRSRQDYGAGREGSSVRKKSYWELSLRRECCGGMKSGGWGEGGAIF